VQCALRAVDIGFDPRSGQTKDNIIGICCFSIKNRALKNKRKYWLALSQYYSIMYPSWATCLFVDVMAIYKSN